MHRLLSEIFKIVYQFKKKFLHDSTHAMYFTDCEGYNDDSEYRDKMADVPNHFDQRKLQRSEIVIQLTDE